MTILISVAVALAALVVGYFFGDWRGRKRAPGVEEVLSLRAKLEQERSERAEAAARAERYFGVIGKIEIERNQWNTAYHQAQGGARKGQELLFADNHRLGSALSHVGQLLEQKPEGWLARAKRLCATRPSAEIEQIIREYWEEHDVQTGTPSQIERAPGQESVSAPPAR